MYVSTTLRTKIATRAPPPELSKSNYFKFETIFKITSEGNVQLWSTYERALPHSMLSSFAAGQRRFVASSILPCQMLIFYYLFSLLLLVCLFTPTNLR